MKPYDHKKIEKKWQKIWEQKKIYQAKDFSKNPKFYSLIEFPYPSGEGLHTGHIRSNTAMDIISRKRRAEGFNVLYPIGYDSFGLPTENYAIKTGIPPQIVTKKNTATFRRQLKEGGFSFDWSREITTSDPKYYKWTQWVFLQMYKHDLAYKKKMVINWCPFDKIGLANEEVIDGRCERCGNLVEKREKEQWMLAITKYADRLDKDLDTVDYLEKIKIQQRNWIGRSEGAELEFKINNSKQTIKVFTTRADTLFGVTYVVLAPEHELVRSLKSHIKNWPEVEAYIKTARSKNEIERIAEDKEKTGVELKGIKAINPANGEEVPVWIADYVLQQYGTGAVMAVPAHDERDFVFAKKYGLPIKQVIAPYFYDYTNPPRDGKKRSPRLVVQGVVRHWDDKDKVIQIQWKKFPWKTFVIGGAEKNETPEEAVEREVREETGYQNIASVKRIGIELRSEWYADHKDENRYAHMHIFEVRLKDGEKKDLAPEESEKHEVVWVPFNTIPTSYKAVGELEYIWENLNKESKAFTGEGIVINSNGFSEMKSAEAKEGIAKKFGKVTITYKLRDWIFSRQRYWGEPIPMVYCEQCARLRGQGWQPVPEKELPVKLPTVKNYQPTDTGESPLAAITKWVNTKCPVCKSPARRETDTMPNWAGSSWYFLRYIDPKNTKALADKKKLSYWMPVDWYNGGMEHTTLHLLYSRFWNKFLFDIGVVPTSEPYKKRTSHGLILAEGGEKMSKSKGNVVNPDGIIQNYGADTLRLYEMFMGPFDQAVAWSTEGIVGPRRFLERVWRLAEKVEKKSQPSERLESIVHRTIKKVSEDIEAMQFNTAVSALMILGNEFEKAEVIPQSFYETFLKLLAPFAPHIAEELWSMLGHKKSITLEKWPFFDPHKVVEQEVTIVVQVNGKVRGEFTASPQEKEAELTARAQSLPEIRKWTEGKTVRKVIYVKNKLINIVIS